MLTRSKGPTGQPYYFNTVTKESTYVRPFPTFANLGPPPPQAATKSKKEKPLVKTPIPGTGWVRVLTTEGNTFYTHKAEKRSVWTVPEEIKEAVAQLEKEEAEKKVREEKEKKVKAEEERMREVERIKSEVEEAVGKRKAEEPVPVDEVVISKKARVEDEDEEGGEEEEGSDDDSEMEDWQREAAEQLAKEAEEEKRRLEEERKREEEEKAKELEAAKSRPLNMPERVDLSIDEAKALFKVRTSISHSHIRVCVLIHSFLDITSRERRQSPTPVGYLLASVCFGPTLRSSSLSLGPA